MLLEINVKDCDDCEDIQAMLSKIDDKLYKMARNEYHDLIYLSGKNHKKSVIKQLIRYKHILTNLFWNSKYYEMDFKKILSKIKTLV